MAAQVVFETKFQGDTFLIYRWHAKHYAFGQVKENGEEVWSGTAHSMFLAVGCIYDAIGKIADDIDAGVVVPQGPFLDANGKRIVV